MYESYSYDQIIWETHDATIWNTRQKRIILNLSFD